MPRVCSAYNCTNRSNKTTDVSYFRFPLRNQELTKRWVVSMKRDKWYPTRHSILCSAHFDDKTMYFVNDRRRLLADVVPTRFDFQTHLKKKRICRLPPKEHSFPETFTAVAQEHGDLETYDSEVPSMENVPFRLTYEECCTHESPTPQNIAICKEEKDIFQPLFNNTNIALKDMKEEPVFDFVATNSCVKLEPEDVCTEEQLNDTPTDANHSPFIVHETVSLKMECTLEEQGNKIHCGSCEKYFEDEVDFKIHSCESDNCLISSSENCINERKNNNNKGVTAQNKKHSRGKSYTCKICNKSFSCSTTLIRHERVHTGEKPFTCNICNKSFSDSSYLTVHKKIHSGETPFTCTNCNKSFSRSFTLRRHKRTHTGEKPFICNICNKRFSNYSYFSTHMKIHTGETQFNCNICNKSFASPSHLTTHERMHTGEKPFTCNFCNKKFSISSNLIRHKTKHKNNFCIESE